MENNFQQPLFGVPREAYKICPHCKVMKMKCFFGYSAKTHDQLMKYCKECQRLKQKPTDLERIKKACGVVVGDGRTKP